tara:strand:- start:229 stop:546 length:318 start_codon:yes stop_codon:yes gene_type:complete
VTISSWSETADSIRGSESVSSFLFIEERVEEVDERAEEAEEEAEAVSLVMVEVDTSGQAVPMSSWRVRNVLRACELFVTGWATSSWRYCEISPARVCANSKDWVM